MKDYIYEVNDAHLNNDELMLNETLFHNANGYLGVRGCYEEGYPGDYKTIRGTYINGFYDYVDMPQAEKLYGLCEKKQTMINVADTQGISLEADGEKFNMFDSKVISSVRSLDMKEGVTERKVTFKTQKGNEFNLTVKRMASFDMP